MHVGRIRTASVSRNFSSRTAVRAELRIQAIELATPTKSPITRAMSASHASTRSRTALSVSFSFIPRRFSVPRAFLPGQKVPYQFPGLGGWSRGLARNDEAQEESNNTSQILS